jgi:hypothetical protein
VDGVIFYWFNFDAMPKEVRDSDTANGFRAFALGMSYMFGAIDQGAYDKLQPWAKSYWQAFEVPDPKPKRKKKS